MTARMGILEKTFMLSQLFQTLAKEWHWMLGTQAMER